MNWNRLVRQLHRWIAVAFTLVVLLIFVAMGLGQQPPEWLYFLPLPPLFLLIFTGIYLFFLPYVAKTGRRAG
ncbi:hypothetical protein [Paracoccus siganidrum]|uniref:Transmembrane protein n=1 Tax=Paracoccus siganidrum TaxID=1276757 RepID=A0A419ACS6_9RHOB|nr:hypothetical protein [Paracoccus siganidrum]RJL22673.1 hypothetical protein D3P05_00315 [Paracoccus siganidrum]RMC39674.1 hypothetical protein C9E82_03405 [Paracoccus siganidrum]